MAEKKELSPYTAKILAAVEEEYKRARDGEESQARLELLKKAESASMKLAAQVLRANDEEGEFDRLATRLVLRLGRRWKDLQRLEEIVASRFFERPQVTYVISGCEVTVAWAMFLLDQLLGAGTATFIEPRTMKDESLDVLKSSACFVAERSSYPVWRGDRVPVPRMETDWKPIKKIKLLKWQQRREDARRSPRPAGIVCPWWIDFCDGLFYRTEAGPRTIFCRVEGALIIAQARGVRAQRLEHVEPQAWYFGEPLKWTGEVYFNKSIRISCPYGVTMIE